jgi:Collagen triple helix repeat (20 copies)
MKRPPSKLTYANVISTIALFLVLAGGGAYAASTKGASSGATLKLCAARKSGDLRLASGGGACKPGEQALTVAGQGIEGKAGVEGKPGAEGKAGAAGAAGERGPQGERGPAGLTGMASPDGRFSVTTTNSGIVLTGPKGSLTFDGEELRASRNLMVTVPQNLTVTNGLAMEVVTGTQTSITTGAGYSLNIGAGEQETVGGSYVQVVGAGATQDVGNGFTQEVEGDYEQNVGGNFESQAGKAWRATGGTEARVAGTTLNLGRLSCQPAARVNSVVNNFLKVTAEGSSTDVNIC